MLRLRQVGFRLAVAMTLALPPMAGLAFDYGQGRGMGAGTAVVADHSAIEMNPAGITQLPRYSIGMLFNHTGPGAGFGFSLLDNKTTGIGMGIDYRNTRPIEGHAKEFGSLVSHKLNIALGEYYEGKVHIGMGYNFRRDKLGIVNGVTQPTDLNNHNMYTGAIVPINEKLQLSLVSYDLAWFGDNAPPPRITSGAAWLPHEQVVLVVDVIQVTDNIRHWQTAVGADFLIKDSFALRGGWHEDFYKPVRRMTWSAGLAAFFQKGSLSYAFNTEPGKNFRHTLALEVNTMD